MKKLSLIIIAVILLSLCASVCFCHTEKSEQLSLYEINHDIQILKVLNLLSLTKEQSEKMIKILEEWYPKRLKNLTQIREAMISGETELPDKTVVIGKKYGEMADTYLAKLDRTNTRIVTAIKDILTPEQNKKAQMMFDLITEDEMKMLIENAPKLIESISLRIELLSDLGIIPVSDDAFSQLMGPLAQVGLEAIAKIKAKTQERIISVIVQPRTIELLKERISKREK